MNTPLAKTLKTALLLPVALSLQACLSSFVAKPITESSRDTSGTFDGRWVASVESTAQSQHGPGNWKFDCDDRSGERFGITVENGQATMPLMNRQNVTYVNSNGQFRFEVPTEFEAQADGRSDSSVNDGAITLILIGSLSDQKGSFTIGVAQFANNGCTSEMSYQRI